MSIETVRKDDFSAAYAVSAAELEVYKNQAMDDIVDAQLVIPDSVIEQGLESAAGDTFARLANVWNRDVSYLDQTKDMIQNGLPDAARRIYEKAEGLNLLKVEDLLKNPELATALLQCADDAIDILQTRRKHHERGESALTEIVSVARRGLASNRAERTIASTERRNNAIEKAEGDFVAGKADLLADKTAKQEALLQLKSKLLGSEGLLVTEIPEYRKVFIPLEEKYKHEDTLKSDLVNNEKQLKYNEIQLEKLRHEQTKIELASTKTSGKNAALDADSNDELYRVRNNIFGTEMTITALKEKIGRINSDLSDLEVEITPLKEADASAREVVKKIFDDFQGVILKADEDKIHALIEDVKTWSLERKKNFLAPTSEETTSPDFERQYIENEVRLQMLVQTYLGERSSVDDRSPGEVDRTFVLALNVLKARIERINEMNLAVDAQFNAESDELLKIKEAAITEAHRYYLLHVDTVQGRQEFGRVKLDERFEAVERAVRQDDEELRSTIAQIEGLRDSLVAGAHKTRALVTTANHFESKETDISEHTSAISAMKDAAEKMNEIAITNIVAITEASKKMTDVSGPNAFDFNSARAARRQEAGVIADSDEVVNGASRQINELNELTRSIGESRQGDLEQIIAINEASRETVKELITVLGSVEDAGTTSHEKVYDFLRDITPALENLMHQADIAPEEVPSAIAEGYMRSMASAETVAIRATVKMVAGEFAAEVTAAQKKIQEQPLTPLQKLLVFIGFIEDPRKRIIDPATFQKAAEIAFTNTLHAQSKQLELESGTSE